MYSSFAAEASRGPAHSRPTPLASAADDLARVAAGRSAGLRSSLPISNAVMSVGDASDDELFACNEADVAALRKAKPWANKYVRKILSRMYMPSNALYVDLMKLSRVNINDHGCILYYFIGMRRITLSVTNIHACIPSVSHIISSFDSPALHRSARTSSTRAPCPRWRP